MLLLSLSTFNSTGGVQKAISSLAHALKCISKECYGPHFNMYALEDTSSDGRYVDANQFIGFAGNRFLFVFKAVTKGLKSKTIILSHINLIPVAILIRILTRKPKLIIVAHGLEVWSTMPTWKKIFLSKYMRIWAVSDFTARQLSTVNGIHSSRITTLNPSIDPFFDIPSEFFKSKRLLQRYKISNNQPTLVTIARRSKFDTEKGYDKVLQALPHLVSEFPNIAYLLCGSSDQEEKARMQTIIRKNNLQKHVRIINFIPEHELTAHYQLADVFVLPSKKEGFGLVFIEAAACGCNIISGNSDGSADAMLKGKLGTMVDPDNIQQLAVAIATCLKERRSERQAQKIQDICMEHFGHPQFIKKVTRLISAHD